MIADFKKRLAAVDRKRVYTAAAALVAAGLAGYLMQRGNHPPARALPVVASVATVPTVELSPQALPAGLFEPETKAQIDQARTAPDDPIAPEASPRNDLLPVEVTRAASPDILGMEPGSMPDAKPAENPQEATRNTTPMVDEAPAEPFSEPVVAALPNCEVYFVASPKAAALVELSLYAPCNPGEVVEIDHAGLKFSDLIGPEGDLIIDVPAMTKDAVFKAVLSSGIQKSAETSVPDFAEFKRLAVMWKGPTGLQLDALENGASYGDPDHLWAENPSSPQSALEGKGGFISVLGSVSDGYAADVYSYPRKLTNGRLNPEVSVEAQVLENTCGGEIQGEILRTSSAGDPIEQALSINVPGCDAVGGYLVLKNLPQQLKLARN